MDTQALVKWELLVATDKQSFHANLKTMAYRHMVSLEKMEDKEIVHIILYMGVVQCKVDTLDSN